MRDAVTAAAVAEVCGSAREGTELTQPELEVLLSAPDARAAAPLFAAAREVRARTSGDAVFLYGFVYFSTYCRNSCVFCFYRAGNRVSSRYRKGVDEVVDICRRLANSGVNLLDLTLGEDPLFHDNGGFEPLVELVGAVRRAVDLPVMISPGVVPETVLRDLSVAGADWYACYQETHTRHLFAGLRIDQRFEERVDARLAAHRAGLLVEDGLLAGVGESVRDRARSILSMKDAGDQQVRVMTFVPQEETPLGDAPAPSMWDEILTIATMRLVMPDRLIPASLDVEGIEGLRARLDAGANVVTSIVPPGTGLCGVANAEYDVDAGLRTVAAVAPRLAELGLRQGSRVEYASWLERARRSWSTVRAETGSTG